MKTSVYFSLQLRVSRYRVAFLKNVRTCVVALLASCLTEITELKIILSFLGGSCNF